MAFRLSSWKKHLLVSLHVLAAMAWFGGTLSLLLLLLSMDDAANGERLLHTASAMHIIDNALIKYPGLVVLISGVMLSVWTPWGLLKWYWVTIKLVLTVLLIAMGILFAGDWSSLIVTTADHFGPASLLQSEDLQSMRLSLIRVAVISTASMVIMVFLTHFKSFGKIWR